MCDNSWSQRLAWKSRKHKECATVASLSMFTAMLLKVSTSFARQKGECRACHYRCCSGPSIIKAQQCWGMLRWAWLKPRMPPDLLWRKWEGREGPRLFSIHLPTALFMCYLLHRLLHRVPSPLLGFYSRCWWIVRVSLYHPQCHLLRSFVYG